MVSDPCRTSGTWLNIVDGRSITCRKRHLKCDEIKPICGPCVKKDKTCEYPASGRRSNDSPAFERAIADAVPVSGQEPTASPGQASAHVLNNPSPEIASYERHEPPGVGWSCSDADTNPPPPTVLDQLSTGQSPIAFQHNYLSPSNASFAAVRWFGLLASDAARDSPQLPSIENSHGTQSHSVDHLRIDGLSQPYSLQYATQVLDSTLDSGASNGPTGHQEGSAVEEELIWQSREAIELLPTEHALFGHFINQVSTWVCIYGTIRDRHSQSNLSLIAGPFRSNQPIFHICCASCSGFPLPLPALRR